jgi:hypothetical protein
MQTRRAPTTAATASAFRENDPKKLYHSPVTGEFNCGDHAPRRITNTWWRDRWRVVTKRDHAEWPVEELGPIQCEVCKWKAKRDAEHGTTEGGATR